MGLRVDKGAIPIRPEVMTVCEHVGIDPYAAISEGTLVATVRPDHADRFTAALGTEGIDAAVVGEVTEAGAGSVLLEEGRERPLQHPGLDPFWEVFHRWTDVPDA